MEPSSTEALKHVTDEELKAMAHLHRPNASVGIAACGWCLCPWPCDAARLAATVRHLREIVAANRPQDHREG